MKQDTMGNIDIKVEISRTNLYDIQEFITFRSSPDLTMQEKEAINELNKWLAIQEKILGQKSKAYWI